MTIPSPATADETQLLDALIEAKLLVPSGVPGVFGRGAIFEDVIERFDDFITNSASTDGAERFRFPPILNRRDFEKSEFLKSFPQLAGSVFSFDGTHAEHMAMLDAIHGGEPWAQHQKMTDVVLAPAACYPLYPMAAATTLPDAGRLFDVFSYCFRHEPSPDPARMQMFRMREFVRVCRPDDAVPWRDLWLERGLKMLRAVGLPVEADVANDPFFGRGGRMLAVSQRDQKLKFEVLMPIASVEKPTAVMSFNYHQDHFGGIFGIKTADGATAHTACVGFGMERIALGLFKTHGLDPKSWPSSVRAILWPQRP